MNRLQSELHRLYLPQAPAPAAQESGTEPPGLIDARGQVRAMVLELARPADWGELSKVWQGVQADLELPAPAIAVSGTDGFQLWFSLAVPVPQAQAGAFLQALCARYLPEVASGRLGLMPAPEASAPAPALHAHRIPAFQIGAEQWSAFVAPDLAPVFSGTPWLDIAPSEEGQADLLSRLERIKPAEFTRALDRLKPAVAAGHEWSDPRRFLIQVMNDDSVALGLRIEAAKALLQAADRASS